MAVAPRRSSTARTGPALVEPSGLWNADGLAIALGRREATLRHRLSRSRRRAGERAAALRQAAEAIDGLTTRNLRTMPQAEVFRLTALLDLADRVQRTLTSEDLLLTRRR